MAGEGAAAASAARERTLRIAIGFALTLATIAVYAPLRAHEFVDFDDLAGIVWNPELRVGSLAEALRVAFTRANIAMLWAPLTTLSLQLDVALYGSDPTGYLVTNAALHLASSLLLFAALLRLTRDTPASGFVAAVFALHPLHVESVAWASERKDVLSAVFFMLTLLAYERYVRVPRSLPRYLAVLACLLLGLLAKPMLVTLPCVLLLLDHWPLRRLDRGAVWEKLPMLALSAACSLVTVHAMGLVGGLSPGLELPMWARLGNAVDAYGFYLAKALWPTGLAAFYPHPGRELPLLRIALVLPLLLALTGAAVTLRRRRPYLLTGWLWFGGMLVPVIGVFQVGLQARADRYMYLPLIGLALALAFGLRDLAGERPGRRRLAAGAALVATLALAVAAAQQVGYWRSSQTLFQRVAEVSPRAAFPHVRLGMVDALALRPDAARAHFARAFERDPRQAEAVVDQLESMAVAHAELGRHGPATETAELAVAIALETGQPERAREVRARLARLRRGRPTRAQRR